ncbi:MAG: hypothetical protein RL136_1439 [Planctomycetota bacterium]|jgi:uncharacterized protein (DUF1684 family)
MSDHSHDQPAPDAQRDAWHQARLRSLCADDGWLTLVGLDFLEDGSYSLGSAAEATLRYAHCADGLVGTVTVAGDAATFTPHGGSAARPLTADAAGEASVIRSGPVSFTLIRRNGRLALRVKDNLSPTRTGFGGIGLYPFDPALVIEARVQPAMAGETVPITNVTGFVEQQPVAAYLEGVVGGSPFRLIATDGGGGGFFVVFGDRTNGRGSYGGGRFLAVEAPSAGTAVLDFNRAYNPPCSFTPFATCPLPHAANQLPVPVEAGERAR